MTEPILKSFARNILGWSYLSATTNTSVIKAATSCPNANAVLVSLVPFAHQTVHSTTTDTARKPHTRPNGMKVLMRSCCHPSDICKAGYS
jgi:hypothetical protein